MMTKTIHYCRIASECGRGCVLCCRVCQRNMQCKERCTNWPEKCNCSTYVCTTEE